MERKVIAIFEDDATSRFIYERLFTKREDVKAYIFESPEEGYAMAKEVNFDIVFIEVHYWSNFGGLNILKKLKELAPSSTRFAAMTSLLQQGDLEYLISEGFSLCLEKPVVFSPKDIDAY